MDNERLSKKLDAETLNEVSGGANHNGFIDNWKKITLQSTKVDSEKKIGIHKNTGKKK